MVAARPRLSIVLDEGVHETIRRVAAVQGRSMSSVVAEMVTELEPGLRQVADLGEAMDRMSEVQRADWRRAVRTAGEEVGGPLEDAVKGFQEALNRLQKVSAEVGADAALTPPK